MSPILFQRDVLSTSFANPFGWQLGAWTAGDVLLLALGIYIRLHLSLANQREQNVMCIFLLGFVCFKVGNLQPSACCSILSHCSLYQKGHC